MGGGKREVTSQEKTMAAYEEILAHIRSLRIVDTHQHLPSTEERWLDGSWRSTVISGELDVLKEYLQQSFRFDLLSAGLPYPLLHRALSEDMPVVERWAMVEAYWEAARYTGFGRVCDASASALYGLHGFHGDTIEALNAAFLKTLKPGRYGQVLSDVCRISVGLNESASFAEQDTLDCDSRFFRPVFNIDHLVMPQSMADLLRMEERSGLRITAFDQYLECCGRTIDWAVTQGAIALKSTLAYYRPLAFQRGTRSEAEAQFNGFLDALLRDYQGHHGKVHPLGHEAQDYVMHHLHRLANKRQMVIQIHTGYQDGAGSYLGWSDPSLLSNQFIQYPDLRFVIFHMGYPHQHKLSALAKQFANVYIDMCWGHALSPEAAVQALIEWLDAVPYNKICAFGSDDPVLDAVVGNLVLAQENISRALAAKVEVGRFDIDRAKRLAECLLKENAMEVYGLA
jgi:hypothetical protein